MFWLLSFRPSAFKRLAAQSFASAKSAPSGAAIAALLTFSRD